MLQDAWTGPVRHHRQVSAGQTITRRTLRDIHDHPVRIPDSDRIVHLQFGGTQDARSATSTCELSPSDTTICSRAESGRWWCSTPRRGS